MLLHSVWNLYQYFDLLDVLLIHLFSWVPIFLGLGKNGIFLEYLISWFSKVCVQVFRLFILCWTFKFMISLYLWNKKNNWYPMNINDSTVYCIPYVWGFGYIIIVFHIKILFIVILHIHVACEGITYLFALSTRKKC